MNWYEQQQADEAKRKADREAKRAADDAAYELEREQNATRRAEREAEEAKRAVRAVQAERDEASEYAQEAYDALDAKCDRLKEDKVKIVATLRALADAVEKVLVSPAARMLWPTTPAAYAEARELLAVLDAQK